MEPALRIVLGIVLLLAVILIISFAASAHMAPSGWQYENACCSGRDCERIPFEAVTETADGYRVSYLSSQGFAVVGTMPRDKIRHSQDGSFHACAYRSGGEGVLRCLYVPSTV